MAASQHAADVRWEAEPVLRMADHLGQQYGTITAGAGDVLEALGDVAAQLAAAGRQGEVDELRAQVQRVLAARRSAELHAAALQGLRAMYVPGGDATDFGQQLEQAVAAAEARDPYDPARDNALAEWEAVATGGQAGAADDEQIDDDIAIEGGAGQLAPNDTCPITGRPILELQEPVADQHGFVYEKEAVVAMLRSSRSASGLQIVAGAPHRVREADLRPAARVAREQKRLRKQRERGGGAAAQREQAEDVIDVV